MTPAAPEVVVAEAAEVEELDFQAAEVEEADFPEKVQRVEADFRLREDKVVRKAGILNPSAAAPSKIGAANSTAKVLRTSKREAVTSRTAKVL